MEPYKVIINNIMFLVFNYSNDVYIKNFGNKIKINELEDYFNHISNNEKNGLACEIIIELGDKKYWDTKDDKFKRRMTNVYKKQVENLETILPTFKIASAIIHYDETSPHLLS